MRNTKCDSQILILIRNGRSQFSQYFKGRQSMRSLEVNFERMGAYQSQKTLYLQFFFS